MLFECNIITPPVKALMEEPKEDVITSFANKESVLIIEDNEKLREYIVKVGFSDPFYFSRCFSKQFGHPPSTVKGQLK